MKKTLLTLFLTAIVGLTMAQNSKTPKYKDIVVDLFSANNHFDISPTPKYIDIVVDGETYHLGISGAIDLGLSVRWAACNLGAKYPTEYGDYYAWGEIDPYYTEGHSQDDPCSNWKTSKTEGYDWPSYKWCNGSDDSLTKYCTSSSDGTVDNKKVLDLKDDAAHVNWGGEWRMPTKEEQDELRTKCIWTWGSQNGVNGYTVVGPNGNSLFLPAAGYRSGSGFNYVGSDGYYWSSSLYSGSSYGAYYLGFNSGYVDSDSSSRCNGHAVRPVCQ